MAKKQITRSTELSTKPKIREHLLKLFAEVEKGFTDQKERIDANLDYWDIYNNVLGPKQFYNGTSQIFVPITSGAIKARKTRFTNQIFPQVGRYVEVTTANGDIPHATMALMEHYVRRARLRTQIVPALSIAGDVEGQMTIYVGWRETKRHTVSRETKPVEVADIAFEELGEVEDIRDEDVTDAGPYVEIIPDADFLVLPVTVDSLEECLEQGGSVTIIRRWSKSKIREMIDDEEIVEDSGESLLEGMTVKEGPGKGADTKKEIASAAGIRQAGSGFYAQVYETWCRIRVEDEKRLVRAYYGGDDQILGCKLCPYWNDRIPVISGAVDKSPGVFKGKSLIHDVMDLQIFANDTVNEGADTAHFSAMPIILTDPAKNPRTGTMILGLAALWETSPNDTKFAEFPPLWKDAFERVAAIKNQIFETLGVNPSMLPQQTGTKAGKRNQAEIAMEQQVDILTTSDSVINIEEQILTPMLQRFAEYDHQFRDDAITIRSFGELGLRARMEEIPPIQMNKRYEFRWFGVEAARNAQQVQQQIGFLNVIKQIPPGAMPGKKIDIAPLVVQITENILGPRMAPLTIIDLREQLSQDPEQENEMLEGGFEVPVSPMDDDQKHIQVHQKLMAGGDPTGMVRVHLQKHMQQMQMKALAAAQQAAPPMAPQQRGGGGPQPGSMPGQPHAAKQPPGAIHQDRLPSAGVVTMPRKT